MSAAPAPRGHLGPRVSRWSERPAPRLAAFSAALAITFGAGAGLGALAGPDSVPGPVAPPHSTTAH